MPRYLLLASSLFAAIPALSCLPTVSGQSVDLADQEIRLTFLATTDIHSRLLPYDFAPVKTDVDLGLIPEAGPFGGVSRLGALLLRERAKAERVLHLDSGDSFQGAPIFNVNFGEVEYRWLSRMKADAAVLGNHEFDAGALNFTMQARDNATFPVLVSNYFWDDYHDPSSNKTSLYTQPYTIKNVGGVRVGVIGVANISSLNSIVEGGNSLQATPLEANEAARAYVELLRPVTDVIVILSHAGLTEDQDMIQGYEAYYEYGKILYWLGEPSNGGPIKRDNLWKILEWFGPVKDPKSVVRVRIPGVSGIDVILGGHLHVVLNPPQQLTDPSGRKVLLSHNGSFAKYLGRLDVVLKMPPAGGSPDGAEVVSHAYRVFPVDSLWCSDAMHDYYKSKFWNVGDFPRDPGVKAAITQCSQQEDPNTVQLLQPYILDLDFKLQLTSLFAYAPRDIARRNSSSGGDSPLGNIAADSMRKRRRVEAEVAVTNSLGIRDNLYAGPLSQESMFNVFPFENTINVMYLSGAEMQEMFDFIAERSATRGCISQAQISGARFTMDCAQSQLNDLRLACDPKNNASDCPTDDRTGRAPWQCLEDINGNRCWAHSGTNIQINGQALDLFSTYRVAVNDYIAKGGSGFVVLKRNTTRIETGIPLRDSLVGYLEASCTCDDIIADKRESHGFVIGKNSQLCGNLLDGKWVVDPLAVSFCQNTKAYQDALRAENSRGCTCVDTFRHTGACTSDDDVNACKAAVPAGPALGRCTCRDALTGESICGNVTTQIRSYCENPTALAIALGVEDGRIARRVK